MNDSESFAGNQSPIEALQRQMFLMLLVLLVVSATLATYFYYEQHIFQKDTENLRTQATPMITAFSAERPAAEGFINQIRAYGGVNPDFAKQVLSKYGIPPLQPANVAAPVKK